MESSYTIEKRDFYIYMKLYGRYDFNQFVIYMKIALDKCQNDGVYKLVVDALDVENANISTMDRFKLGEKAAMIAGRKLKSAIIWPEQYINRFTETVAVNRGGNMRILRNLAEAEAWLAEKD